MTESQYIKTLSVEILAYLEYKKNEARKNGANLDQWKMLLEQDQQVIY